MAFPGVRTVSLVFWAILLLLLAIEVRPGCGTADGEAGHAYRAEANTSPDGHGVNEAGDTVKHCSDSEESCPADGENRQTESNGESVTTSWQWDPKGYIMFCPCMGRLGNQAEHYLGALAFAKALDRTLVLPPFRSYAHVSYGEYFEVEPIKEFHRVILMEDFMQHLAPTYWPPGKRIAYSHLPEKSEVACDINIGNPFKPFWDHFGINFDDCIKYQLNNGADITKEGTMQRAKTLWDARFPADQHPVLALRGSPGSYPMIAGNRAIQQYFKWTPAFFAEAGDYIRSTFHGEPYVGIHLRNGIDWVRACEHATNSRQFMASPQCLDKTPGVKVTQEICLPSLPLILEQTSELFDKVQARHLFIATDMHPHVSEFENLLKPRGVSVHYWHPSKAEYDLIVLGQADYFIGNCVSSFTSFVKRERDANGRPSAFWGQPIDL